MKKLLFFSCMISSLFVGCAPKSELAQARAEAVTAQERIKVLEQQQRTSQGDLEKSKEEIAALRQRIVEMAAEMKALETRAK